ncbi:uroporphyrinogen decarboxylase [bacterium]|nr:uroporphyrinogen decarboxylase [bacterium]
MITHHERLRACLNHELPDRPPVALWRHFPVDDQSPDTLAASTLNWQRIYNFDLIKVTPASSFSVKDWGVEDTWEGNTEGTRRYVRRVIRNPKDWEKIKELGPTAPHLAAQLECLQIIKNGIDPETPFIQTIFNPLSQAKHLAGNETLIAHIRMYPEAVLKGLEVIARSTQRFVEATIAKGIDGIFYAVQHAQASLLTIDEYRTFGSPFDQRVIEPAKGSWLNLLHLHGRDVYFSLLSGLPFPIINWHDRETAPTLDEAMKIFPGVVCGGLKQDSLVFGTPEDISKEAKSAMNLTGKKRMILSTGCVAPIIAPHGNLIAAREIVES